MVERREGHRASYLPPAFDCVLDDGTTYPADGGYAWFNGLVAAFAATSAVLAVGARHATGRRPARRTRTADAEVEGRPGPELPGPAHQAHQAHPAHRPTRPA